MKRTRSKPSGDEVPARKSDLYTQLRHAQVRYFEPMKALGTERLPRDPGWIYEIKFDGVRALALLLPGSVRLVSRAGNDLSAKYPEVVEALARFPARESVLDGEIVALDPSGRSSFQLLQAYSKTAGPKPPLLYYVFDLPVLRGRDFCSVPLAERKQRLEELLTKVPREVRFSANIGARTEADLERLRALGLEGLIAKRADSCYQAGKRSGAWLKFKWRAEQEFVIGGFTRPKGSRTRFGSLLVGYHAGPRLLFAGRVGTGFDSDLLEELFQRFQKLVRPDCPFANLPERLPPGSGSKGLTAREMRECTWLRPVLVCQVAFAEWTRDDHLRQPSFLGLRDDKPAAEVVRE